MYQPCNRICKSEILKKTGWIPQKNPPCFFVWRHYVEQVPLPKMDSRQGISRFSAGFLLQAQSVGNEGNKLTVGRFALMVVYRITE